MIDAMTKGFISKDEPADLINVAIEELIKEKFELPSFNTLVKTARHIRAISYRLLYFNIYRSLNDDDKQIIDKLFLSEGTTYSAWNHLKEDVKRATISHLRDLIKKA